MSPETCFIKGVNLSCLAQQNLREMHTLVVIVAVGMQEGYGLSTTLGSATACLAAVCPGL